MTLHHKKHHQTYVTGLNTAEESYAKAASPKEQIALQAALKFNGGGHINHSLFWKNLAPSGSAETKAEGGEFKSAIEADFGSVEAMKKEFNTKTAAIQGSGWGWLVSRFIQFHDKAILKLLAFRTGIQQVYQKA
jgi:Fe-Mn family superoxide dismutase